MGGEARAYQFYRFDEVNSNGQFTFNNDFTRRDPNNNNNPVSGNGFATFLLGLPTGGGVATGTPRTEQYRYYALYLQDDWKLSTRATINVGLRWDYQPAVTVQDNLTVSAFDTTSRNPLQSQLTNTINPATGQPLDLRGGLLFANRGGPKTPYKNDWNNMQPRLGVTYKVTNWMARARITAARFSVSPAADRPASTPRTSSGRRRSLRRRRTTWTPGRRGSTRSRRTSSSRSPASSVC